MSGYIRVPKDMREFKFCFCMACNADAFCPTPCDVLERAEKIGLERIKKAIIRNEEDYGKLIRYIKSARL